MGAKTGSILNNVIGAVLLIFLLYIIKKKSAAEPDVKIYGMSIRTISIIIYIGIALDVFLVIETLVKK
jgi:hypothetical protein